jgi:arginine/lysine/histidine/glutamine transport system substrate-binding/permease protein
VAQFLDVVVKALPNILLGAVVTLKLTALSVILGMIGGILIGIARLSPNLPLRWLSRAYVDFFRGTPLLVQIFWIYFGFPALANSVGLKLNMNQWTAAVLALSLNSAAYLAEIVRAGIQSIEIGQREASESLGLGSIQTMRYVIFPQAFRRMIPPIGNEFITLLKDTSLVAVIGLEETFRRGQLIVAQTYQAFQVYTAVAIVYLILTTFSSQAFTLLERWMNPVEQAKRRVAAPVTDTVRE